MPLIDNINVIAVTQAEPCRPPPELEVTRAELGDLVQSARSSARVDPLLIEMKNTVPGATLEILVVNDPKKTWDNARTEVKTIKVPLVDLGATQQLALSDAKVKELGINPGDVFEIRQVDTNGNRGQMQR